MSETPDDIFDPERLRSRWRPQPPVFTPPPSASTHSEAPPTVPFSYERLHDLLGFIRNEARTRYGPRLGPMEPVFSEAFRLLEEAFGRISSDDEEIEPAESESSDEDEIVAQVKDRENEEVESPIQIIQQLMLDLENYFEALDATS